MKNAIARILKQILPELTAQLHLPRWGKVVALPELPAEDGERASDPFYPRYAIDVKLIDENGTETNAPILQAVPLMLPGAGAKAGTMQPPTIGAIVEIAFAYGRPDKPFIRGVLPFGFDLPAIKENEARTQTREGVYRHIDQTGNIEDKTDKNLTQIIGQLAELQSETRKVTATAEQTYKSPKTWIGSETENVLKLLSELMATVTELATVCAQHKHLGVTAGNTTTGLSDKAADFTSKGTAATNQKSRLDPITKN